jgi:hypothetical protein
LLYGEDASVLGDGFRAGGCIDDWLGTPASPRERDWASLAPPSPAAPRYWHWSHSDGTRLGVTVRDGVLQWQQRWVEVTQSVTDFRRWGLPAGVQAVPAEVLDALAGALGMSEPPWLRPAHPLQSAWIAAARSNQLAQLQALLADDPDGIRRYDAQGFTVLHRALECYADPAARWLVAHGADLRRGLRGTTPVLVQAAQRHLDWLIEACLLDGQHPDDTDSTGLTALAYAVLNFDDRHAAAHAAVVAQLINAGADPDFVLPAHRQTLGEWAQARQRLALYSLLGVAEPGAIPAAPAPSSARCYAELDIFDQHSTASGAAGAGRWTAWVDLPESWVQAPPAHRDHWLRCALALSYRGTNAELAEHGDGGSYQLIRVQSQLLTAAQAQAQPWLGGVLYRVEATHLAAERVRQRGAQPQI